MGTIQRYGNLAGQQPPIEWRDGAYVLYADHLATVRALSEALEAALAQKTRECEELAEILKKRWYRNESI